MMNDFYGSNEAILNTNKLKIRSSVPLIWNNFDKQKIKELKKRCNGVYI